METPAFIESLFSYFSKPASENTVPEGACPNCWGHYEYDGQVRKILSEREIDIQNHRQTRAFIEEFVVNHVEGIKLKNLDNGRSQCPGCGKIT